MGTAPIPRSPAVARLLRDRRNELGLTLRDVEARLVEKGERLPASTLARIEWGKLDPGVRRLHLLVDLYQIPSHLITDLVELEALAGPTPPKPPRGDLQALFDQGEKAWQQGNVAEGLSYLFAVRQFVPKDDESRILRQKACIAFAAKARDLGKIRVARQIVDEMLCEPPDPSLTARVLLLAASLWKRSGSIDAAIAFIRQAETRLSGEIEERARVLHQKAVLLSETGPLEEAEAALQEAIAIYRSLKDSYGEARALALQLKFLERRGEIDRALSCARKIVNTAKGKNHQVIAMVGQLELGRLLVASGALDKGLDTIRAALGQAVTLGDQQGQFVAHRHLWKVYEQLGDKERAALERQAACYFVRFTDERSPEAEEVRELAKREGAVVGAANATTS